MTETQQQGTDDFFEGSVRSGAPSLKLEGVNDGIIGEIVDQYKTEAKVFGSDDVKTDKKTGAPILQLVVILQTNLRNWDRVAKVPLVDPTNKQSGPKDPSEDDGKRALYIEPWTNLHAAVGRATAVHNNGRPTGLRNGATLGVKIERLEDVGKGNPKRVFAAVYTPPTGGSDADFFGQQSTAGGPGDASAQSAPAAPAQQAAPAPAAQAPTQSDPWGANSGSQEPPF